MKMIEFTSYETLSAHAADLIAAQVLLKPNAVLGLATGSTPEGTYAELVKKYEAGRLSFADVTTFNLDEYCGIDPTHDQSYRYFMNKHLFSKVNVDMARTHVPSGTADNVEEECARYEQAIAAAGGIDLQLLGLGVNGHIGFNEPADDFPVDTHKVTLHESTIDANSRFFASRDEVPTHAVTMGLGSIMRAKKVLLLAFGDNKVDIVKRAFLGPVTPDVPASVLQLHPDVTVLWGK